MTGRLWSEKTPIMRIGIVVTLVIISGCRLAGIPGEISVSPPAESLPISGGNEVIGTEIVGELDTSTEDSTATDEVLPDASMDEEQILDYRTYQEHIGRDTQSNLLFKGVLDDKASSIYTGLIQVHKDASGTNAYQTNRTIKLSEDTWAESVPNLEIENNDVRCSHASTVSPVDDDQRFYLESRGIPTESVDQLIVQGFLNEVVQKLPIESVNNTILQLLLEKQQSGGL